MTQLYILGLLARGPMSGYDIQMALEELDIELWSNILVGSIYHALKKLENNSYIHLKSIEKTGHRQRSIYEITEKGTTYMQLLVSQTLSSKPLVYPADVYAGLTFINHCTKDEVVSALQKQYETLLDEKTKLQHVIDLELHLFHDHVPEIMRLTFENMIQNLDLQLTFLQKLKNAC